MAKNNDIVALTLGGNDVGFTKIVRACLLNLSKTSCKDAITRAENAMKEGIPNTLDGGMFKAWDAVFKKMPGD